MMCAWLASIAISVGLVLIFRFINKRNDPAILGIYQQKSKTFWFKFAFMWTWLTLRQLITHVKRFITIELKYKDEAAYMQEYNAKLEDKYDLGDHLKSIDAVYFNGMSEDGDRIICGLAKRPKRVCDSFLYLKLKGEDLLLSPSLPDTYLHQSEEDGEDRSVKGLRISKFMPMRTWKLCYDGEMKTKSDPKKTVNVSIDLTWSAQFPQFEYDSMISPCSMAADLAREPWSRDYFTLLQQLHQTHYEQMGCIAGTVRVDGKITNVSMQAVRDRTFGACREWRNFHRYVLHFIFMENGDCIAVGSVSQPAIMSHLTIGYVCLKADGSVHPVQSSDFQLYQHGENGVFPKDYGFLFVAGGKTYATRVQLIEDDMFYIGKDREGRIYEKWSNVEINGVKGKACVEVHYNNTQKEK